MTFSESHNFVVVHLRLDKLPTSTSGNIPLRAILPGGGDHH